VGGNPSLKRKHARELLMAWYRQAKAADWATPADVKRAIRSASILKDGRAVFNLAGNKYRWVVWINYPYPILVGDRRPAD
jgi:mRNA interferase HigB